jgi:hypothetical protein
MGSFTANNKTYINKLQCTFTTNKIKMFAGNTLPPNHVWCDGNNGTPNLKDKFIYGISSGAIGTYGDSKINAMPMHSHNIVHTRTSTLNQSHTINGIQRVESTGGPNGAFVNDNKGGGNHMAHKDHTHSVNNSSTDNSISPDVFGIPLISTNADGTSNDNTHQQIRAEFMTHNSSENFNINTTNSSVSNSGTAGPIIYNQKYILIGYIMENY